ncbi:MAG: sugar phosphate nucleotidyltransferase, partial [Rhodospirillaceae bacterium]
MMNSPNCRRIYPVLLSGGSGVRLWPLSRERFPKQLLNLTSSQSMLQETARRVADATCFAAPLVICNEEHRFIIAEQLRHAALPLGAIVLEPVGRNTAAAVAVAALKISAYDPEALLLVLPADHLITNQPAFLAMILRARAAAEAGHLVTFGIVPTAAETGFGYIQSGPALSDLDGVQRVAAFVEKPSQAKAEEYLATGEYYWNSGMFMFKVAKVLAELERFEPLVLGACRRALAGAVIDIDFCRLEPTSFAACP